MIIVPILVINNGHLHFFPFNEWSDFTLSSVCSGNSTVNAILRQKSAWGNYETHLKFQN